MNANTLIQPYSEEYINQKKFMKRNWNLQRHLLGILESGEAGRIFNFPSDAYPIPPEIFRYDENQYDHRDIIYQEIAEHVVLLGDEGFIEIAGENRNGAGSFSSVFVYRLTASGHNFLDLSRDNNHWKSVMGKVMGLGGSTTVAIITQLLISEAKRTVGL
jgi:Hypothetical protein (DUF2513)